MESKPTEKDAQKGTEAQDNLIGGMQDWRAEFIGRLLRVVAYVGIVALLGGVYYAVQTGRMWLIPVYLAAYLIMAAVIFSHPTYHVQAVTLVALLYGLAVLDFLESGRSGSGRLLLVTIPILATMMVGVRAGFISTAVTVLTVLAFGWAYSSGLLTIREELVSTDTDISLWISNAIVLLALDILVVAAQGFIIPRMGAMLERSRRLTEELNRAKEQLEEQVEERTRALQEANYALQRRAIQLEASVEVAQAITSIFDIDRLLRRTVDLIRDRFGFYHAGIFLLDDSGQWAVLREATGEAGAKMKAMGHRLAVGETSMVGWTALHRQPRIALYAEEDEVRFANPLLPHTRSEMTLPMMVGDRLLGVLNVQSVEEAAFDEDDVRTLQAMANQIAIALDNARKVSDEAMLLEAASPIYRVSRRLAQAASVQEVADAIIASVQETGADGCVVVEFEYSSTGEPVALLYRGVWRRDRQPQFATGTRIPVWESPFSFGLVDTLWTVPDVEREERLPERARETLVRTGVRAIANIPLRTRERVIGQVVVLRDEPGPFSAVAMRLYEALSDQAAVALERARLWETTQQRVNREQLVSGITEHMQRATNMENLMRVTAEELNRALGGTHVYIKLRTEELVA